MRNPLFETVPYVLAPNSIYILKKKNKGFV